MAFAFWSRVGPHRLWMRSSGISRRYGSQPSSSRTSASLFSNCRCLKRVPPPAVEAARRLDNIAEIRRLAKKWKNCLAGCYLDAVIDGRSVVYLSPDEQAPAVCVVNNHGRLGWALEAAKGPKNDDLQPARLEEICCAFAALGIPQESAIGALEHAARAQSLRWRGTRRRQRQDADYEEMYEEFEEIEAAIAA